MKLSYVSIEFYRSITDAYKIDLSNITVLLGKNNEGKTNVIRAINLGMDILRDMGAFLRRRFLTKSLYDWQEDYPISLQVSRKRKDKNKNTNIRFDFEMGEAETEEFYNRVGSNINGNLSVFFEIKKDNAISVTVPKRGKNATALSNKIREISSFICEKFEIQYIPAMRSENDAYSAIFGLVEEELAGIDDQKYKEALAYIENKQEEQLALLAGKVKAPLKAFLPQVKSINLRLTDMYRKRNYLARKSINIEIDDGVLTSFTNKGDGVKSLTTIAMLSQISSNKNRLIIVDEPENHLHPEAVRYINSVLCNLAQNNQVLISTHNPILVNRKSTSSNWIVESGTARQADRIDTIRNTLGVICSDNLMYSDYVVVVEGPSDRELITKLFNDDEMLRCCLENKTVTIRSIGGTHHLKNEILSLQKYCCNFIVLLDGDIAGKTAADGIKQELSISSEDIRYFTQGVHGESELEDLYNPELYKGYLLEKGIDVSNDVFKNRSKKWSVKINDIGAEIGMIFSKEDFNKFKEEISTSIIPPVKDCLTESGYHLLVSICDKIKEDLREMSLIQ